ncbi:GHKL domain-containing protein [Sporofaciens sp. SGI.106]|uniref:GHKL domain-containing protein n=1 Tax=Sporofaciens sp. SGI.106 TaxID=3420568 RepID=UPI003CFEF466
MPIHISATELLLGVGDFLTIYLFGYMHRTFCEKRNWIKDNPLLVAVIYLFDWCMLFVANLQEVPPLNLLAMIAAYLIPLFLIYQVKSFRELTNFWFYMVGTMVFLLMAMPLISVVLIVVDMFLLGMGQYQNFNSGQFLQTAVLLVIVNIAVFIVLEKYTGLMHREMELAQEKSRLKSDADIMQLATKSMKERLQSAETVMQKDRMMRHDRRHFEALLYQLLEDGKTEEAKKYLEERLAMEPKGMQKYCENTTVNAAISHYLSWAKKEGIQTTVSANIPVSLPVDEMELAITISNLLENAVYGCLKLSEAERYLKLTAKYKNQLLLEIENSCEGTVPLNKEGHPFSNENNHGIGTRSVLAFVNKTNSEIQYLAEKKRFRVRMIV